MAYANSHMFYGWKGEECIKVLEKILKGKITLPDNKEELEDYSDEITGKIQEEFPEVTFKIFEGGLSSDANIPYVCFKAPKTCQSCNDDDIDSSNYTILELKEFMNMSFDFCKKVVNIPRPSLINLVVSDSK